MGHLHWVWKLLRSKDLWLPITLGCHWFISHLIIVVIPTFWNKTQLERVVNLRKGSTNNIYTATNNCIIDLYLMFSASYFDHKLMATWLFVIFWVASFYSSFSTTISPWSTLLLWRSMWKYSWGNTKRERQKSKVKYLYQTIIISLFHQPQFPKL